MSSENDNPVACLACGLNIVFIRGLCGDCDVKIRSGEGLYSLITVSRNSMVEDVVEAVREKQTKKRGFTQEYIIRPTCDPAILGSVVFDRAKSIINGQ